MRIIFIVFTIMILFSTSGCYAEMTGTVVDAETGRPIEGAVVLVEWTVTKGVPGMTHTESYKVVEKVTDKEGKFTVSGVLNPFVNLRSFLIYKQRYVAWRHDYIFPNYKKRTDFKWSNSNVFRLEHFKPEYSYINHRSFIGSAISTRSEKKLIYEATEWEGKKASEERDRRKR